MNIISVNLEFFVQKNRLITSRKFSTLWNTYIQRTNLGMQIHKNLISMQSTNQNQGSCDVKQL